MRLIAILLLLLAPSLHACSDVESMPLTMLGGGVSASCSTPDNGDEFDEGFLDTGYENDGTWNNWAETVQSGDTIDEDYAIAAGCADCCSEGLRIDNNAANASPSYVLRNRGSALSGTVDFVCEIYIEDTDLDNFDSPCILHWSDTTNYYDGRVGCVALFQDGSSNLTFRGEGSSTSSASGTLSLDTWYTVQLHIESGASASYVKVDGGSSLTFTANSMTNAQYLFLGNTEGYSSGDAAELHFGYCYANTP